MRLRDFNFEDETFIKMKDEKNLYSLIDIEYKLKKIPGENVEYNKEALLDFYRSTAQYLFSGYRYRLTKYIKKNDEESTDIFVVVSCVDTIGFDYPIKNTAFYHNVYHNVV